MKTKNNSILTIAMTLLLLLMQTFALTSEAQAQTLAKGDDNFYHITSEADWNTFVSMVNGGTDFNGETVVLDEDISVTTLAGTTTHKFAGTFDGQELSITVSYDNTSFPNDPADKYAALFRFCNGVTIKNLTVKGTITTKLNLELA